MAFSIRNTLASTSGSRPPPGKITAASFSSPTALNTIVIGSITGTYTSFDVKRTGGTQGTFTATGKTGTTYTDPTTLLNNTQYTYTIIPINSGITGTAFTAITNPNNATTPGKIYTLANANDTSAGQGYFSGGTNKVVVRWQTGVYTKIFLANTTTGGSVFDATAKNGEYISDGSSKDSATDLTPNTPYTYTITCTNGDGINVANVGVASYTPWTWGVCNKPTTSSPGDTSVTITCTGTFSRCKFEFSGGTGTPSSATIIASNTASQAFTGLDYNTTYSFYCSPCNGGNYVSYNTSESVTFTTLSTPATPSAPTVSASGTTITVTITAVTSATSYKITNDTVSNSGTTLTAQTITTTDTTFTGVIGYSYTFICTATNAAGTSGASTSSTSITLTQGYRYFKFTTVAIKTSGSNMVQLSEFIIGYNNARIDYTDAVASNPGGSNPGGEDPAKSIDNSTGTKWLDFKIKPLIIDFTKVVTANMYTFSTANDSEGRDPVSWTVSGSSNGTDYTLLDTQTNYSTPGSRYTQLPWFNFN